MERYCWSGVFLSCRVVSPRFRPCLTGRSRSCGGSGTVAPVQYRSYAYLYCPGQAARVLERMEALEPLYLEALPLTLEEIFIYELGGVSYAVQDILL